MPQAEPERLEVASAHKKESACASPALTCFTAVLPRLAFFLAAVKVGSKAMHQWNLWRNFMRLNDIRVVSLSSRRRCRSRSPTTSKNNQLESSALSIVVLVGRSEGCLTPTLVIHSPALRRILLENPCTRSQPLRGIVAQPRRHDPPLSGGSIPLRGVLSTTT